MTDFKSKFIYSIFVLRLLMLLALIGAFSLFIFYGVPSLTNQHSGLKGIGLISIGLLMFGYLIIVWGISTFTQRFSISIINGQTMLRDNIFGRHLSLDEDFKGFSISNYGDRKAIYNFKTLIFYFTNGQKVELPQFLYSNFKDIMPSLAEQSIKFLGHEPYKWKNLFSRDYNFE